jgi:hypothetical protein
MLDEVGEGCLEVDVDGLLMPDDGVFMMLDDLNFELLVEDLVLLEGVDLVVLFEVFFVLVGVILLFEDDDCVKVVLVLVEILFVLKGFVELDERVLVLVEIFLVPVEVILVLEDNDFIGVFFVLVMGLWVLVKGFVVLVEDFLVVFGVFFVAVELSFPSTQLQSLSKSLAAYFRKGEEVLGLKMDRLAA